MSQAVVVVLKARGQLAELFSRIRYHNHIAEGKKECMWESVWE